MSTFIERRVMQYLDNHIQQLLNKQSVLKQEIRLLKQDISDDEKDLLVLRQKYLEAKEKVDGEQLTSIEGEGKALKKQIEYEKKKKQELLNDLDKLSQELLQAQNIENHNLYEEIKTKQEL